MRVAGRPLDVMSAADVGLIHQSALRILDEVGMEIQNERLLTTLAEFGLTVDTAAQRVRFPPDLVERFIAESHARGLRCLRIVHGRGLNSPGGVSVLKSSLPRWLARGQARRIVLAYTSALPNDGGTGASYVLLRRNRQPGSL